MNEIITSTRNQALPLGLRAALAAVPVVLITLVVMWVDAMVATYAVHLCRWPATISCHESWGGWQLASPWFALLSAICLSGVVLWVMRGTIVKHLWPVVGVTVGFPALVFASGPRLVGPTDLLVFGLYGTYAVFLSWQVLAEWVPAARRALAIVAVVVAAVQLGVIAMTPTALADVAERNGLTPLPSAEN